MCASINLIRLRGGRCVPLCCTLRRCADCSRGCAYLVVCWSSGHVEGEEEEEEELDLHDRHHQAAASSSASKSATNPRLPCEPDELESEAATRRAAWNPASPTQARAVGVIHCSPSH